MKISNYQEVDKGDTANKRSFKMELNINGTLTPIDLTNVLISSSFRRDTKTGRLAKSISVGSGITVTNAVNGQFDLNEFLVTFDVGLYYYDVTFTFTDGRVKTYFGGTLDVLQNVPDTTA